MKTQKRGLYFPEIVDIPGSASLTAGDELHKALQAFKLSQERYENAERAFTAALYRGERPSRVKLERLECEYYHAAIFAANVALGRITR